jgi:hypothetical protein
MTFKRWGFEGCSAKAERKGLLTNSYCLVAIAKTMQSFETLVLSDLKSMRMGGIFIFLVLILYSY